MEMFTLKYAGKKYRMSLASLTPAKQGNKNEPRSYVLSCGAHKGGAAQGLSLEGNVPLVELVRWARKKGFLKWQRKGGAKGNGHATGPKRGATPAVQGPASGGSKREVAGR